ncbi:hypothetical protein [Clostridium facile]|nr:hypothetical protein [Clostridium facile]
MAELAWAAHNMVVAPAALDKDTPVVAIGTGFHTEDTPEKLVGFD